MLVTLLSVACSSFYQFSRSHEVTFHRHLSLCLSSSFIMELQDKAK